MCGMTTLAVMVELAERQMQTRPTGWERAGTAAIGLGWIYVATRMLTTGIRRPQTPKYLDSLGNWSAPGPRSPRTSRGLIAAGVIAGPVGLALVVFAAFFA